MKRSLLLIWSLCFWIPGVAFSQATGNTTFPISDLEFKEWFGYKPADESPDMYTLLGAGFFRTPSHHQAHERIQEWIQGHPNARVIPVYQVHDKRNVIYCWVVDGNRSLNVHLVKKGTVPGNTMQIPIVILELYEGTVSDPDAPRVEIFIPLEEYEKFLREVYEAETLAQNQALGIWAPTYERN
ncbi:hypothetical protein QLX67_10810 [Balneolaceae bacterium ANBcel3]|nr:hypothetical protein [Balneolaceae bacterium ANBcel3]